ncbi:MAG: WYL domain-containing protein, partial [Verrucomicrobiota bacterium]
CIAKVNRKHDRIRTAPDNRERYSLENLGLALSFRPFAPEDADLNVFRVTHQGALQERRVLKFEYRNLGTKNWQARRVHPYHMACIDSHWYLFAHDVKRERCGHLR